MKKYIFGCLMTLFCGSMTMADADCCSTFRGFYVGGNIGPLTHFAHRNDHDDFAVYSNTRANTSYNGGVQVGADWQRCNSFFGLAVDWNSTNACGKVYFDKNDSPTGYVRSEMNWYTTIRARAGVSLCDTLFYLTGGAVVGRFDTKWKYDEDATCFHSTRWGWTGGVGTEIDLGCNFSLGGEVSFLQFGNEDRCSIIDEERFLFGHSDDAWVGKITLNYRLCNLCKWF